MRPFHLAFPVHSIKETINWYTKNLSCKVGRKDKQWVDFNFFGHQISAHKINSIKENDLKNIVDGDNVPVRHFGIILKMNQWKILASNLSKRNIEFVIKPHIRFENKKGEQATMFVKDPSNNVLEFKAFKNDSMIFEN